MSGRDRDRSRGAPVLVLLLCAVMTVRLAVGGQYRQYVRNSMGVWLLLSGLALAAAALLVAVARNRAHDREHDHDDHDDHDADHADHDHRPVRVGWLLLAPVLAVLIVAPRSLGTYAFDRAMTGTVASSGRASFTPLAPGDSPAAMSMSEFDQRAADRDGESFGDREVRLVGFVAQRHADSITLARFQIACCAADARPHVVHLRGIDGGGFATDQWVEVTGRYVTGSNVDGGPALDPTDVRVIAAPGDPYEDG